MKSALEGRGRLGEKQAKVLIICVSGTRQGRRGGKKSENFEDVINRSSLNTIAMILKIFCFLGAARDGRSCQ